MSFSFLLNETTYLVSLFSFKVANFHSSKSIISCRETGLLMKPKVDTYPSRKKNWWLNKSTWQPELLSFNSMFEHKCLKEVNKQTLSYFNFTSCIQSCRDSLQLMGERKKFSCCKSFDNQPSQRNTVLTLLLMNCDSLIFYANSLS